MTSAGEGGLSLGTTTTPGSPTGQITRQGLLKGLTAGTVGAVIASTLGRTSALAAGTGSYQQPSFQATGPASASGIGFDASMTSSGAPVFQTGVNALGATNGLVASGLGTGVYGSSNGIGVRGDNVANQTGVLGVSFSDSSKVNHGAGTGVQGNSGSGFGVAGFSDSGVAVYGQSSSAAGISGRGNPGVVGVAPSGSGVSGITSTGYGVQGTAAGGIAIYGSNNSPTNAAISGFNGSGPAIQGKSFVTTGVIGISTAPPGNLGQGSGVTGLHGNGQGSGVTGYSLRSQAAADHKSPSPGTGVFGQGDTIGLNGEAPNVGVRGASIGNGTGILGISFADGSGSTHGGGAGVQGQSGHGAGIAGFSDSSTGVYGSGNVGVWGQGPVGVHGASGKGIGVAAGVDTGVGVQANGGNAIGVFAHTFGKWKPSISGQNDGTGPALQGSSTSGYGAELSGGRAPLRLVPAAFYGKPAKGKHQPGELVMDAGGNLFLCVQGGRPGTWREVALK